MKKVLILAFAACMFFACQTKDSYVSDFTQIIEEVEAGADVYSPEIVGRYLSEVCRRTYLGREIGNREISDNLLRASG